MRFKLWMPVLAGLIVVLAAFNMSARAQDGGSGLQVIDPRQQVSISPGEVKTVTIQVKNVTTAATNVNVSLNDFEPDGATGNPKIRVDTQERLPSSIQPFIKSLEDFTLAPGETKVVKIELNAPGDIPAGAYYGAIRFTATPKDGDKSDRQLTLNASVASLVLVEVPGNITEQIQLRSVKVGTKTNDKFKAGSFFMQPPNALAVEIKNTGNGFSKPFGRVSVNKGNKEVYGYELNNKDPRGIILPNSVRSFQDEIKDVKSPGHYTVTASISHGSGGEVINYNTSFWYIPLYVVLAGLGLLVALAAGGYVFYRKKFAGSRRGSGRR